MAKSPTRKISVISRDPSGWHVNQIKAAAAARATACEIVDFDPNQLLADQVKQLGDAIIYRASSLDLQSERTSVLPYLAGKYMINEAVFRAPFTPYKYFQQNVLAGTSYTSEFAIPTYRAHDRQALESHLDRQDLKFPFIAKPNKGAQGKGIELIRTVADLETFATAQDPAEYVYQNFIRNDGDWRIIIVGGRPLGAIKRIAQAGAFLNNVSQGASSVVETDPTTLKAIYPIAIKAASAMGLRCCGADVIRDADTGKFYILETNTAPQWDSDFGFQAMTGVDVGGELVDFCLNLLDRDSTPAHELVEAYYKRNLAFDPETSFHFASRLWLWTGDDWARQTLDAARGTYIGTTEAEITATVAQLVTDFEATGLTLSNSKRFRQQYFDRYPRLSLYVKLLFKMMFASSIYQLDLRPQIRAHVTDAELIDTFTALRQDHDAIRVLSTHAVNFFSLLSYYFRDDATKLAQVTIPPAELLEVSRSYDALIDRGELDPYTARKMRIYLLTHVIIGASQFYQRRITGHADLLRELEQVITTDFAGTSIDNKNEFLVCAKLCGQTSSLEPLILGESAASLSWAGNFIVESTDWGSKAILHSLTQAEHRSVLFIMANRELRAA
jgi:glutathione synthase/RimK-type ligase-like ATP-grasp enzyme